MKKITQIPKTLLLTLLLIPFAGKAQLPESNILRIHDAVGLPQSSVVIDVEMENNDPITAFQIDIPLPSGFSYIAGSAVLNPLRHVNHVVYGHTLPGTNIFRTVAFDYFNTQFLGNTGVIMSFKLNTPSQTGNYMLEPENCIMGNCIWHDCIHGLVSIIESMSLTSGDSNCNGSVNVMDVITTVKYMLGDNPQPFCFENADVDGDGIVNILDVVSTTDIILN
ncbi:MAG: dockerin type I repeat-containing protein [Bacteroidales bacterium]